MKQLTKTIAILLWLGIGIIALNAQNITGQWYGVLNVSGTSLRLVFHINQTDDGYQSTMDSPDQGALGIPVYSTTIEGNKIDLQIHVLRASFDGELIDSNIIGNFHQSGLSIPLTLSRTPQEAQPLIRPQEPQPPFPYQTEDIEFKNSEAGITLAGTLTLPERGDGFTAAILISGSGPQDRNEEIFGHKPFLVIADHLTRHGIAVLRFDDRGVGQSGGDFASATTADFATDVESAIAYLKTREEINPNRIGLIGHSEGGIIAPMVAARSDDVAFVVMLAGPGVRGDKLILEQTKQISQASGLSEEEIAISTAINTAIYEKIVNSSENITQQEMIDFLRTLKDFTDNMPSDIAEATINRIAMETTSPWIQYFLRYDPAPALSQVKCPVWAVCGDKDLQVSPLQNLPAIYNALESGGNQNKMTIKYGGLNHLFQQCPTGLPSNYAINEETFAPNVLNDMTQWILSLF